MKLPAMPVRSGRDATMNFDKMAKQIPVFVTGLPPQPTDGQEVYYQNATMAEFGYVWHLRYRAGSNKANKWEFVGGTPLAQEVYTLQATVSNVNVDLATVGPSAIVPISGIYYITFGTRLVSVNEAAQPVAELAKNGIATGYALVHGTGKNASQSSGTRTFAGIEVLAGDILKLMYRTLGGEAQFTERTIAIQPVRVG